MDCCPGTCWRKFGVRYTAEPYPIRKTSPGRVCPAPRGKDHILAVDPHVTPHPHPRAGTRSLPRLPNARRNAAHRDPPQRCKCGRRSIGVSAPMDAGLVPSSAPPPCDESWRNAGLQLSSRRKPCRTAPSNPPCNATHPAIAVPCHRKARSTSSRPASRPAIACTQVHRSARSPLPVAAATPWRRPHPVNFHNNALGWMIPSSSQTIRSKTLSLSLSLQTIRSKTTSSLCLCLSSILLQFQFSSARSFKTQASRTLKNILHFKTNP